MKAERYKALPAEEDKLATMSCIPRESTRRHPWVSRRAAG